MRWLLKRWWFWGGMLFMLVATCAGYLLIPVEEPRISQANYDKIRLGMTKKQVEHLLGETRDASVLSMGGSESAGVYWSDDDGNEIGVSFKDKVDAVTDKYFSPT